MNYLKANHLITYGVPKVLSKVVEECQDVALIGKNKQEYEYTEHVKEALGMIQQKYPCLEDSTELPNEDSSCGFNKEDFLLGCDYVVEEHVPNEYVPYEHITCTPCFNNPGRGTQEYWMY